MSEHSLTPGERDAKQLELSYKTLLNLQRKTLSFLTALSEYDKKRQVGSDEKISSRMAFIVTPLMVNHYNHMHHVYRSSMYGKVPDLCDQTGGISCTDLSALREELAKQTTDVNRSLTSTFRAATLPNLEFNFKAVRDNVIETAIRMLDSIEIKQPDLTHSIRDDYIQNVRAIQETLTNALEKSKERSAELKSRLGDTLRKLSVAEKTIANSPPGEGDMLRKELFKLKERFIEKQQQVLTQQVEIDAIALKLKETESECNLLRELMTRLNEKTKEETGGLVTLRAEIFAYTEGELEKIRTDYRGIRNELSTRVQNVISRSNEEKQEAIQLCHALLNPGGDTENHNENVRFLQLQQDFNKLQIENEGLKRQIGELQRANTPIPNWNFQDYEVSDIENIISDVDQPTLQALEQRYVSLLKENALKENQQREIYDGVKADLDSLYRFLTDSNNIEAALQLATYIYAHNVPFYSEYANLLLKYLETIITDDQVKVYMRNKTLQVIQESGVMDALDANRVGVENLSRTLGYSDNIINDLLSAMEVAYNNIVRILNLDELPTERVTPEKLKDYFEIRFGNSLRSRIIFLIDTLKRFDDRINILQEENVRLRRVDDDTRTSITELRSEPHLNTFDGDPTVFEEVLQKIWIRPDSDQLKRLLNAAYYALALDRVNRYETSTANADLKLYNLVEYTILTNHIKRNAKKSDVRPELVNPRLNEPDYFLHHFFTQLGNVQVENFVNTLDLRTRNKLAIIIFNDYYIPVVNKEAFVMSIEGPFANFHMVYKV